MKRKGFTLTELLMIMIILAIVASTAIPHYYNLVDEAESAAEDGVTAGVRAGISTYFATNKAFPSALDTAAISVCSSTNVCFDTILGQGAITDYWEKTAANQYLGPTGSRTYSYTSASGSFQ